ncbi:hypothetical protein D1007_21321 [Hordeum vulgare]|nr:hypothetical protein D1007_21321 [Hordeum vulgare]
MADARRARAECHATRVAQTTPAGPAGARRSLSPVMNAATGPDVMDQQGSSQSATKHPDGRTATPSLVWASGSASRSRPEMPHDRRPLAMAIELLRYRPVPDCHNDWLQRIAELVTVACDSAALSWRTARNKTRHPHLCGVTCVPSPGKNRVPATDLASLGRVQETKQAAMWFLDHAPMHGIYRRNP